MAGCVESEGMNGMSVNRMSGIGERVMREGEWEMMGMERGMKEKSDEGIEWMKECDG